MHEARNFLDALFARCSPQNYITLTALPPVPNLPTPSRHIQIRDSDALADALERLHAANTLGWSAVVGVGARRANFGRWKRGGKADLAELPALFVDIDDTDGAEQRIADFCAFQHNCRKEKGGDAEHKVGHLSNREKNPA